MSDVALTMTSTLDSPRGHTIIEAANHLATLPLTVNEVDV